MKLLQAAVGANVALDSGSSGEANKSGFVRNISCKVLVCRKTSCTGLGNVHVLLQAFEAQWNEHPSPKRVDAGSNPVKGTTASKRLRPKTRLLLRPVPVRTAGSAARLALLIKKVSRYQKADAASGIAYP